MIYDKLNGLLLLCALTTGISGIPVAKAMHRSSSAVDSIQSFDGVVATARAMPRLYSLLISHQGRLVLEEYFNGSGPDRIVNIKSASKSVISALVGIAIARGDIASTDSTLGEFFPDYINTSEKAAITIGQLLSMQAGLAGTSNRNYGAWVQSPDWIDYALKQPLIATPGTEMEYSTGNTHLLSAILTRATGRSTLDYAREVLAGPLGFRLANWPTDPAGIHFGGNDMEMTARQMLMFGEMYLEQGRYNDRQIVPGDWVADSMIPRAISRRDAERRYGYGWWMREMAGFETVYAWGFGGQFIILVPALDLVVVTTSSSHPDPARRAHRRELGDLIERYIIPTVASHSPENR